MISRFTTSFASHAVRSTLAVLAFAAGALAQVPPGWCVVSARKQTQTMFPGDGGIYITHPRTPMAMHPVAGLPGDLTAASYTPPLPSPTFLGANCVLLHESGDVLVAPAVAADQPLDLCRIPIQGDASTGFSAGPITRINLGYGPPNTGAVAQQMAFVSRNVVIVAGYSISAFGGGTGPMGMPAPVQLARVNLVTRSVTPVQLGAVPYPPGVPSTVIPLVEAVTYDASSDTVAFGVRSTTMPPVSWVCSFPQTNPQLVTVTSPALPGQIQNLATRHGPNGVETVAAFRDGGGTQALYLLSGGPATPVLPNPLHPQWVYVAAVAVEPSTSELLFCGASHVLNSSTYGVHWLEMATGSVTQLSNVLTVGTRGALSGIAVAPALRRSQSPTSCGAASGAYEWSDRCHPDKLPFVGNVNFFIDVDHASGTTPVFSLALVDFRPAPAPFPPLPQCPNLLALVPLSASPLPPSSIPPQRPNTTTFGLPLPACLLPGLQVYLQSAHFTAAGIFASELLEVNIL